MATPLLIALGELGSTVDVSLSADYRETADLLRGWTLVRSVTNHPGVDGPEGYDAVVPAVPPFYWRRFASFYRGRSRVVARPPDALFYIDEQEYYLAFARSLGFAGRPPHYTLPIGPANRFGVGASTVVLAPGCKTGEMAAKRWPWFPDLAARFADGGVGTDEDLRNSTAADRLDRTCSRLSAACRSNTAELLASAGTVVADGWPAHVAARGHADADDLRSDAACRARPLATECQVMRAGLPCRRAGSMVHAQCVRRRIDCLRAVRGSGGARGACLARRA